VKQVRVLLLVALVAVACGGREVPDDQALHQDIVNDANGSEVTFDATVLNDPVESGGHERFEVKATTGEMLEVVVIHGRLYIDPGPRVGVHCTHARTSSGCPSPGWIMLGDNYYE
jgi:hypothetical protein